MKHDNLTPEQRYRQAYDEMMNEPLDEPSSGFDPFWFFVAAIVIAMFLAVLFWPLGGAKAEPYHSDPWLLSWIPASCCVTNDCCWQVGRGELTQLPDDMWMVNSTQQIRKRTNWSPDGKFYRCACDFNEGKWITHQGAFTRCIFVPLPAF